jgi:hypothetical protein
MIELVYDGTAATEIRKEFPDVKIEDASDFIHEGRIQVELPDEKRDAFYKHAMKEGYYEVCLGFKLMMMSGEAKDKEYIHRLLAELKAEKTVSDTSSEKGRT